MGEEILNFNIPHGQGSIISVFGVGGGGCNAVNHMFSQGIKDVDFIVCNTDSQALHNSLVPNKLQLGPTLTEGLGAGNKPEVGKQAAIESIENVKNVLGQNTKMVFITAGFGGGTGTGAAPVIAKAARELGILTIAIVTIPFYFEGENKIEQAKNGIELLQKHTDSLLIINNEKLREMYGNLPLSSAFVKADKVLTIAAKGIAEIITLPGYINVDFADVETVMRNSGVALMGSGEAIGKNRAVKAITEALSSPLLNNSDINGARNILLNLCSGNDEIRMDEVGQITDCVQQKVGADTNLIWGTGTDSKLEGKISVTIIATGFNTNNIPEIFGAKNNKEEVHVLLDNDHENNPHTNEIFNTPDDDEKKLSQKQIDFKLEGLIPEIDNDSEEKQKYEGKSELISRSNLQKLNIERLKQLNSHKICDPDKVDNIENEPAYKRKKMNIEQKKHSQESNVSRYSLFDDPDQGPGIKSDNSYLHDNVD
ncbi:cell division protein FtsZ [Bacteroidota bacterium]